MHKLSEGLSGECNKVLMLKDNRVPPASSNLSCADRRLGIGSLLAGALSYRRDIGG